MIRSTDRYQTVQEFRAAQARAWLQRNARQIRAEWWARKAAQAQPE
jgi:hypothetical protein